MSTLVTNELFARPGRGDDVAGLLLEILGDGIAHFGEGIAARQSSQP